MAFSALAGYITCCNYLRLHRVSEEGGSMAELCISMRYCFKQQGLFRTYVPLWAKMGSQNSISR